MESIYYAQWTSFEEYGGIEIFSDGKLYYYIRQGSSVYEPGDRHYKEDPVYISEDVAISLIYEWDEIVENQPDYSM